MARPRKPTAMKALAGTLRADRQIPNEPRPPVAEPVLGLAHLSPPARRLWPQFSQILLDMGVLTVADGPALCLMIEAFAEGVEARRVLQEAGSPYYRGVNRKSGAVMVRTHPAVSVAAEADRRFAFLASQFGLTPAARGRVSASIRTDEKNPWLSM